MKRLIKHTEHYNLYEADFMGFTQTFRQWYNNTVEIEFNDSFANANGFKDREQMLNQNIGMRESLIFTCGQIPQWIMIDDKGNFTVRNTVSNHLLN